MTERDENDFDKFLREKFRAGLDEAIELAEQSDFEHLSLGRSLELASGRKNASEEESQHLGKCDSCRRAVEKFRIQLYDVSHGDSDHSQM